MTERSLSEKFEAFVMPVPEAGCWLWTGTLTNGYGNFRWGGKVRLAHRIAFEMASGAAIPSPRMFVCHKCDTPSCVNPDHLFLGTNGDNMWDCARKGRNVNSKKTHCPQGHEYTTESVTKRGWRICHACEAARESRRIRHRIRRKAA